ncbi:MAG TPA: membrane dipeptidase [Modestobacter sp.]|jgi:membrane dipeptidase|nr:membrane dipeptidase [Modestobacter sp.]
MTTSRYDGYESYSYLTPGKDFQEFELVPEIGRVPAYELDLSQAERDRAEKLLAESIVVSLHEHPHVFPEDMSQLRDYIRTGRERTGYRGLAQSGMTAVFDNMMDGMACVTSNFGWKWDDVVYDIGMRLSDLAHQDFVTVARSVADIEHAHQTGRVAIVLALEAATPIENELDRLDILYGFGVRQMGIAYSESNGLGSGLKEPGDGGLTLLGRRAVERMNKLGIAVDVSHSSDRTCMDAYEVSSKPVLITHAGARAMWDTPRMKPDEVLLGCAQTGGVIGIEAAPHTTITANHPRHSLESVMEHFAYCVELMGIDHVTFGPDTLFGDHVALHDAFAANFALDQAHAFEKVEYVAGIENPAENYHNIIGWLVKHGYSDGDIQKVVGGNIMRVLREIW